MQQHDPPDGQTRLQLQHPLDLRLTFGMGGAGLTTRRDGDALWWATRTAAGGASLRLEVRAGWLEAHGWGPGTELALGELASLCGLEDGAEQWRPEHPGVQRLWRRFPGLRIRRTGQVFPALLAAVLGQRVTTASAARSLRELTWRFGERAPGPQRLWLHPRAEDLAGRSYAELHPSGVERHRALTIIRAARLGTALEAIATMPRHDAYAAVVKVKGIGPWTAPLIMAEAWGDADAVPIGDLHLPSTVAWHLAQEERADDRRMVELLRPFIGQRSRVIRLLMRLGHRSPRRGPKSPVLDFRDR